MNYKEIHEKFDIKIKRTTNTLNKLHDGGDIVTHGYDVIYDKYFEPYRHENVSLCEIGILEGDSVFVHSKYFDNVDLYCYDIDIKLFLNKWKDNKEFLSKVKEVKVCNSTDKSQSNSIKTMFDIIIDDGDHNPTSICKTFQNFYPKLKNGGIYVIEDVMHEYRLRPLANFFKKKNIIFKYEQNSNVSKTHGMIIIKK